MRKTLKNNSLTIAFFILFLLAIVGQIITGLAQYNKQLEELHHKPVTTSQYFRSGHFFEATFENWESEFLQMAMFVVLTISLRQKGSSESKKCEGTEDVDREPDPRRKGAPWPVRKGGFILKIYKNSLTLALTFLFILSFFLHLYGSFKDENEQLIMKGQPVEEIGQYIGGSRFWFESFENWQSEFLSVFAIIGLSIFLRQKGSSQSKPVDAPNSETGD